MAGADVTYPPRARARILDAALALMSRQGTSAMSMRQLAAACELNVATLYHYFPSKDALIKAVIEERRYGERLATDGPHLDPDVEPRDRLAGLVVWLWNNTLAEESVLRLLLGEALRGEPTASASTAALLEALDAAVTDWLTDGFPELETEPRALATVVRSQVIAFVVEHLALAPLSPAKVRRRARDLAVAVFP